MYEGFTDRAQRAMQLANQAAQDANHFYLGTEHILLALIAEGAGGAIKVLHSLDVDPERLRADLERLLTKGPDSASDRERLPQTPRAAEAIEFAIEEARALKHPQVGTAHILLGLLRASDGVACQVLVNRGAKLEQARELTRKLGRGEPLPARPRGPEEIEDLPIELHIPAADLNAELKRLNCAKDEAVDCQNFEQAAALRDQAVKLRQKRKTLLSEWIGRREIDPRWLSANEGAALDLARRIGGERSWDLLPDLAESLDRAGCNDFHILSHCRQPGKHSGNCWVVDLLLAKVMSQGAEARPEIESP